MACDIYTITNPTGGPLDIYYTDCNGNAVLDTVNPLVPISRCILEITNIADGLIANNMGLCDDCRCRTALNTTGSGSGKLRYVDCNNNLITSGDVGSGSYIQFCAKLVSFELGGTWDVTNGDTCIDNKCPCKCYYTIAETRDKTLRYFDCDSNGQATVVLANSGLFKNCNTYIIQGPSSPTVMYDSGNSCVGGNCPTFFCQCYTVTNNGLNNNVGVVYLNCDSNMSTDILIAPGETFTFCALNVQYLNGRGGVSPIFPEDFSVTNSGDCFNGQCQQNLSIEDQLLYDILTTMGPCPDICEGKNEAFGGPNGIEINDIKTGLVL